MKPVKVLRARTAARPIVKTEFANSVAVSNQQLMTLMSPPIDIVFNNLTYTIKVKDDRARMCQSLPDIDKRILKGVTGIIKHGRVTAIMGASGAGKTSLLNILACRISKSRNVHISGEVLVNMRPYDYDSFGDFANYVMQNDILMQTLTVRETLEFAASMTLNVSKQERDCAIDKLINDLKLEKCADVLVGGHQLKGISGGQRKRTSIAFELISDPQVVFLDEPTSGLDSLTAYVIVWYMKKLAQNKNKTIAMTIHQPGSEIFHLFHDLILMVQGRLVYQGPAADSISYFSQMGFPCPEFSNPPDYFMSIMHHESKKNVLNYPRYFQSYNQQIAPRVSQVIHSSERGPWQRRTVQTSFWRALYTLMWRDALNIQRNPNHLFARVTQCILISLVFGGIFWSLSDDYSTTGLSKSFYSKNGGLFFLGVAGFLSSMSPVILTFPLEKAVLLKEQSNKMYSIFSYFLSRSIIELPLLILGPLISSLIIYWMVDLRSGAGYFFMFMFISFLASVTGNAYGFLAGSFFSDAKIASGILPLVVLPLMIFSGYFKNRADLPSWAGWIEYISPMKYSFIEFATNEYQGTTAPMSLLNFDVGFWLSVGLMFALIAVTKILTIVVLSLLKTKLQ